METGGHMKWAGDIGKWRKDGIQETFRRETWCLGGRNEGEETYNDSQAYGMCSWEQVGTITCHRRFGGKKCCILQEGGHRARPLMKGWGLTLITYSVFLILIFNKEDIGKHIALITVIIKRNTDYIKKLSLSKLLPAAFICFESTESLSHLQKPSLCHWVTFFPYIGV